MSIQFYKAPEIKLNLFILLLCPFSWYTCRRFLSASHKIIFSNWACFRTFSEYLILLRGVDMNTTYWQIKNNILTFNFRCQDQQIVAKTWWECPANSYIHFIARTYYCYICELSCAYGSQLIIFASSIEVREIVLSSRLRITGTLDVAGRRQLESITYSNDRQYRWNNPTSIM